jgi:hypothetical protein
MPSQTRSLPEWRLIFGRVVAAWPPCLASAPPDLAIDAVKTRKQIRW